ncbi:MAG: hypothetical protein QOF70_6560, partial [Acetobacteraceae bacterium]|nr:hypothetical protein [Acetobacteraceae bacterium]
DRADRPVDAERALCTQRETIVVLSGRLEPV